MMRPEPAMFVSEKCGVPYWADFFGRRTDHDAWPATECLVNVIDWMNPGAQLLPRGTRLWCLVESAPLMLRESNTDVVTLLHAMKHERGRTLDLFILGMYTGLSFSRAIARQIGRPRNALAGYTACDCEVTRGTWYGWKHLESSHDCGWRCQGPRSLN